MIVLEDRRILAHDIDTAHMAGARVRLACDIAGIDQRTLQRWNAHDGQCEGDGRPGAVRPLPRHALSSTERAQLLEVANEARFAEVPPARIVPMLADKGCTWPASPASHAYCVRMDRTPTLSAPRLHARCVRRQPISPWVHERCGAGT